MSAGKWMHALVVREATPGQSDVISTGEPLRDGKTDFNDNVVGGRTAARYDPLEDGDHCTAARYDPLEDGDHRTAARYDPLEDGDHRTAARYDPLEDGDRGSEAGECLTAEGAELAEKSLLNKMVRRSLVKNRNPVEVMQADPSSPLYSVKTFEELRLKPELLQGVYTMGFNRPSKIQENALPMMLAQPPQNLIAQSQSGTGKTAAFSLAMLSHINTANLWTQCLCVSPTYELALQIGQVIQQMGKFLPDVKVAYAVRGNRMPRGVRLQQHIVIGTPGTVLDWCSKYGLVDTKKISMFVLDEADVMMATQGHRCQSLRIHRQLSKDCQMLLFSATFDEAVWAFAEKVVPEPNIIRLKREEETLDTIRQFYIVCRNKEDKFSALCNLYATLTIAQAMIFCRTRVMASWLSGQLAAEGHQVALLSGELTVEQRAAVIARFRDGKEKVLVTTNVCSRGIDVEQVSMVVNFDLPMDLDGNADNETYLHRIGRTGRFGRRGFAVNLVDSEFSMKLIDEIQEHFNRTITKLASSDIEEIERHTS